MATYVPRVLICGDAEEFKKIIGDKPVKVVGQIFFRQAGDEAQIFFNGQALDDETIRYLPGDFAEYLLFTDALTFNKFLETFPLNIRAMSARAFAEKNFDGFYAIETFVSLRKVLNENFSGHVLDFDRFFVKTDFHASPELNMPIDCVGENIFPIMQNVYDKIFRTFDECKYHTFDAIILSKERTPDEFVDTLIKIDAMSKNILAFVRHGSDLERRLISLQKIFEHVTAFRTQNGSWCLLKKNMPPTDVGVYIVTHKDVQLAALPEGYKIIHAGHVNAKENFGYLGDDTGDNISALNRYLDETTALYWLWKNTSHKIIGLCHYRRFLTTHFQAGRVSNRYLFDAEKILSAQEILKLLDEYDIIVHTEMPKTRTQRELMLYSTRHPELVVTAEEFVRKHLSRVQPEYLDAFDAVMNSYVFFAYGIHITRRNIFDDYCAWLFSFMIDATIDFRDSVTLGGHKLSEVPHEYSRIMSFFAERMLTVWLMKNHLRIKTLPIMFRDDI